MEGPDKLSPPEKKVVQGIWETRHPVPKPKTGQRSKRDKETGQTMEVNGEPYGTNPLRGGDHKSIRGFVDSKSRGGIATPRLLLVLPHAWYCYP